MATARLANTIIPGTQTTTVNVATSTIASIDLSAPGFVGSVDTVGIHVVGYLIGIDGANNVVTTQVSRAFKRIAGTLTALGAGLANIAAMQGDAALLTTVAVLDATGTTIRLRATGIAATTVTWQGYLELWTADFTG